MTTFKAFGTLWRLKSYITSPIRAAFYFIGIVLKALFDLISGVVGLVFLAIMGIGIFMAPVAAVCVLGLIFIIVTGNSIDADIEGLLLLCTPTFIVAMVSLIGKRLEEEKQQEN